MTLILRYWISLPPIHYSSIALCHYLNHLPSSPFDFGDYFPVGNKCSLALGHHCYVTRSRLVLTEAIYFFTCFPGMFQFSCWSLVDTEVSGFVSPFPSPCYHKTFIKIKFIISAVTYIAYNVCYRIVYFYPVSPLGLAN